MTMRAAIAALGTRITFLVLAWLMLAQSATLTDVAIVAGAQLLSYVAARLVAQRLRPMTAPADLLSVVVLAAMGFYLSNVVVLASLAAALGLLRGFGDRSVERPAARVEKPSRDTLVRILLFLAGAVVGGAALWFGAVGALWANAMVFAVSAAIGTLTPASNAIAADDGKVINGAIDGTIDGSVVQEPTVGDLPADPLARRLALTLFATNLFVQAGAVLLVVLWTERVAQTPQLLGLVAAAFMLGLLGGGVTFAGLTRTAVTSIAIAVGCLAGGAGAYFYFLDRPPALLVVVATAIVAGVATASVIPLTGTLLSEHIPAALRSKVDGLLATVSYIGIPVGTVAAAVALPRVTPLVGLASAAGAYLVAILIPIFVFRSWRKLLPEEPAGLMTTGGRLPARLAVTLAYTNGQWIVEVRRGRALLGSRHLVKSADAMNMLAVLDVPGVRDSVEKALTVDQVAASRQAERMRNELAELEARLAGLTEMVEITDNHKQRTPEEEKAK